jgi:hypothetical protein
MANLKDLVKEALVKKNTEQHSTISDLTVDTSKTAPKPQVTQNKPTKKAAGRGR